MAAVPFSGYAQTAPTSPVGPPPTATSPAAWTWEELKAAEFEQRDEFTAQVRALHARFEPELAELRSRFKETDASMAQKKAMAELDKADFDFTEKMKALDNVSVETWETVKSNLLSAWTNLQEAFKRTRPTE